MSEADIWAGFLDYGILGLITLVLFWRLWKVSDRMTDILTSTLQDNTDAARDMSAALTSLAEKIERERWRSYND